MSKASQGIINLFYTNYRLEYNSLLACLQGLISN